MRLISSAGALGGSLQVKMNSNMNNNSAYQINIQIFGSGAKEDCYISPKTILTVLSAYP